MIARPVITREPDRRCYPITHRLWWWRRHCEEAHGATEEDYRSSVMTWHREHHPDCEAKYPTTSAPPATPVTDPPQRAVKLTSAKSEGQDNAPRPFTPTRWIAAGGL